MARKLKFEGSPAPVPNCTHTNRYIMATARSRSRAPAAASKKEAVVEPVKRERSTSRPAPAARAPRASKRTSPVSGAEAPAKAAKSCFKMPSLVQNGELVEMVKRVLTVWLPAYTILFLVEKYQLVATWVSPRTVPLYGEKGQTFALLAFFHLANLAIGSLFKFETCCRLNTGSAHRVEMALWKLRGNLGVLAAALIGAFVMQVPAATTFMYVFVWAAFNWAYFVGVLMNCDQMVQVSQAVVSLANALLFHAFIKNKLIK